MTKTKRTASGMGLQLASMYLRSLKMHNPENGTHATLETFAAFADVPFRISPLILSKADGFLRNVKP
jgi:hypothetical protein